jgi:hypothetical protein
VARPPAKVRPRRQPLAHHVAALDPNKTIRQPEKIGEIPSCLGKWHTTVGNLNRFLADPLNRQRRRLNPLRLPQIVIAKTGRLSGIFIHRLPFHYGNRFRHARLSPSLHIGRLPPLPECQELPETQTARNRTITSNRAFSVSQLQKSSNQSEVTSLYLYSLSLRARQRNFSLHPSSYRRVPVPR